MTPPDSWPPEENRRDQRVPVRLPGELIDGSVVSTVIVTDISDHGVAFVSNQHPPAGGFRLRFAVKGEWQEPAAAIALGVESAGSDEFLVRARFIEPNPTAALLREETLESARRRVEQRLFDA